MAQHVVRAVGFPWYRREDYERIRALMVDGHTLPATFEKWFYAADKGARRLQDSGHIVERVHLDPDEFPEWCRQRGLDLDSEARRRFAAEFVARKYQNRS